MHRSKILVWALLLTLLAAASIVPLAMSNVPGQVSERINVSNRPTIQIYDTVDPKNLVRHDGYAIIYYWDKTNETTEPIFVSIYDVEEGEMVVSELHVDDSSDVGYVYPVAAWHIAANQLLIVWQDVSAGYGKVYGRFVSLGGTLGSKISIATSQGPGFLSYVRIASGAQKALVVFKDSSQNYRVYGCLVSSDGSVQGPFQISTDGAYYPHVAYDSSSGKFLVVWGVSGFQMKFRWVDEDGNLGPETSLGSANTGFLRPAKLISVGQGKFALAYIGHDNEHLNVTIISAGSGSHTDVVVSTKYTKYLDMAYAFGKIYLVYEGKSGNEYNIYSAVVTTSGAVESSDNPICTASGNQRYPNLDFDGEKLVAVWKDHRNSAYRADVYGATIKTDGQLDREVEVDVNGGQTGKKYVQMIGLEDGYSMVIFKEYDESGNYLGTYGRIIHSPEIPELELLLKDQ